MQEHVSVNDAIRFLNEISLLDPDMVFKMVENRIPCNDGIANHRTVQVSGPVSNPRVGLVGIMNGLFGADENGRGAIGFSKHLIEKRIIFLPAKYKESPTCTEPLNQKA